MKYIVFSLSKSLENKMYKFVIFSIVLVLFLSCVSIENQEKRYPFTDIQLENAIKSSEKIFSNTIDKDTLEKITDLNLENKGIKDLKGIEKCINLKRLILANNSIKNIQPIVNLKELEELDLTSNPIENIEPIKDLINLRSLTFGQHTTGETIKAKITTLEPLRKLINLEVLRLGHLKLNQIDLSPISQLKNLKELNLQGTGISDLSSIQNLTNLEILWLHWGAYEMRISDISKLSKLTNLKVLDLDGDTVSDFTPILGMKRLNELSVWGNRIKDLSVFTQLLSDGAFLDKNFWSGPMIKIDLSNIDLSEGSQNKKDLDTLINAGINILNRP
jgi:Leucine-rich repeat (LRR) protein